MYRIRFHGRGGQGIKTAGRILGTAFFLEGYEVQDAPRYGAERRGAPLFAYVRASRRSISERGVIRRPDLVVIADDTLVGLPQADVLAGITERTVLAVVSDTSSETWKNRLALEAAVIQLPFLPLLHTHAGMSSLGIYCASAAARLCGVIESSSVCDTLKLELGFLSPENIEKHRHLVLDTYEKLEPEAGCVKEGAENFDAAEKPDWIELKLDPATRSAPAIHAGMNSGLQKTGLQRFFRPVIDLSRCKRCWWLCSSFCPDSAILVEPDGTPHIDYDHCKGCLICVSQCPLHCIGAIAEHAGTGAEKEEFKP
jgi:pyruvate ferredoxin oxidoreductase gamma subunit